MKTTAKLPVLTVTQRYIYNHFLYHRKNNKHSPCFVPRSSRNEYKIENYFNALNKLEELGLISTDRTADNYQAWIIKDPTPTQRS